MIKRDYGGTVFLIISSILTLGIFNLLMYIIDGITPKMFFSKEDNFFCGKDALEIKSEEKK